MIRRRVAELACPCPGHAVWLPWRLSARPNQRARRVGVADLAERTGPASTNRAREVTRLRQYADSATHGRRPALPRSLESGCQHHVRREGTLNRPPRHGISALGRPNQRGTRYGFGIAAWPGQGGEAWLGTSQSSWGL